MTPLMRMARRCESRDPCPMCGLKARRHGLMDRLRYHRPKRDSRTDMGSGITWFASEHLHHSSGGDAGCRYEQPWKAWKPWKADGRPAGAPHRMGMLVLIDCDVMDGCCVWTRRWAVLVWGFLAGCTCMHHPDGIARHHCRLPAMPADLGSKIGDSASALLQNPVSLLRNK